MEQPFTDHTAPSTIDDPDAKPEAHEAQPPDEMHRYRPSRLSQEEAHRIMREFLDQVLSEDAG